MPGYVLGCYRVPLVFNFEIISNSNFNGSYQKWVIKYHFIILNNVLASLNSVFTLMIDAKIRCHFINSMFFYSKI